MMEDDMIIDSFFERSEQAIAELSTKYGKLAHVICNNILGNNSDSEECVNDSLFKMWTSIPPDRPDSLNAYFVRIVRNMALDRNRQNTAVKRNGFYDVAIDELEECLSSDDSIPKESEAKELSDAVNAFLGTVKEEDRVMFIWRYYLSDSVATIAKNMNLKESVVSLRLYRTRERLKKYLEKENLI